jgi:outer membrane protein assembly factor BamB
MFNRIASLALIVLGSSFAAQGADWPRYHGPNFDGIATEGIDRWPPVALWTQNVGTGYSSVSVSGSYVYAMGWSSNSKDNVYCFNAASGSLVWTQSYSCGSVDHNGTRCTPTVDGNQVYTLSHEGRLSCFDKATGAPVWNVTLSGGRPGWGYASSPLVEGNLVIVNVAGAGIAVNKATGATVWNVLPSGGAGYASPVPFTYNSQRTVAIFSTGCYGIDPATGAQLWKANTWQGMADPIISYGKVWISAGYGAGAAVYTLGSGNLVPVWTSQAMNNKENSSVLYQGYVYGIHESAGLRCVNFNTGAIAWTKSGFGTESVIMIANGQLVLMTGLDTSSGNGDLVVAAASSTAYTEIHRATNVLGTGVGVATWAAPVVANGRLYIQAGNGVLKAFDVSPVSSTIIYGDANGDGAFSLADINQMVDWLLVRSTPPASGTAKFTACDVNGDGQIMLADLNLFVDRLLGRITKFPVEP